ncbi:MAG: hypothetical protein LUG50_04490 [Planctomycetaceae bacterium]|nr:hypothetical protein [Planctomycetaceae bacterium]
MFRSTGRMVSYNNVTTMQRNFRVLNKVTNQLGLEQQVTELEDDPMSANIGVKLTNLMSKINQYRRNLNTYAIPTAKNTDGALTSMVAQTKGLAALVNGQANSATSTDETRSATSAQISETLKSLMSLGNYNDGTRYIFGGSYTSSPPFTTVNGRYVQYNGNNDYLKIAADANTNIPINSTGQDVFGNLTTTIPSRDLNPGVNLTTDYATRLSDLNNGQGVPKGKIMVYYSAYPDGLEVDLSKCETLEDVKDAIENTTLEASRALDPNKHSWIDNGTLDYKDLQDRYVKVTVNPEGNGISLQEIDRGEPLPEPTAQERKNGLAYSGQPGYQAGQYGVAQGQNGGSTTVYDKENLIYGTATTYAPLRVDDYAQNKVAEGLGIRGTANSYDPTRPDSILDGYLHGRDLDPRLSDRTLLADLEGYNDATYTFTNGAKPKTILVEEAPTDSNSVFNAWNLSGVAIGQNTGRNGELYAKAVNVGTAEEPEIRVELYTSPVDSARPSELVATGTYTKSAAGGTVILEEANSSGLSGSVGIVLPGSVGEAKVNLKVSFPDTNQASVHVPAFEEEAGAKGQSKDVLNIASGWNIRGLDKPPASGFDVNHPATTDLDGNVSVNFRRDGDYFIVELSRPAYGDQPAAKIAEGRMYIGDKMNGDQLAATASGRIEFIGEPGFEGVGGSVYIELPSGTTFGDATVGTGADNPTTVTYPLQEDFAYQGEFTPGGAMALTDDLTMSQPAQAFKPTVDTVFKKGQVFENDVWLPSGGRIPAGTPLAQDTTIPAGTTLVASTIVAGTVLPAGTTLSINDTFPAGTVIPRGSYLDGSGASFPADGMTMYQTRTNPYTGAVERIPSEAEQAVASGFNVRATFATVEDFNRAVQEKGIYVRSEVSADGRGLEFSSTLAGAWLTVAEDSDCYEQMGDTNNQLSNLNLNGLVKGANTDNKGNVYTEVIYYPPDPNHPDRPVTVTGDDGTIYELEPGYYVRVYSDAEQMKHDYENRDNTTLVAEGFVPAGKWNSDYTEKEAIELYQEYETYLADWQPDPTLPGGGEPQSWQEYYREHGTQPFVTQQAADGTGLHTLGYMNGLVLEERNDSGVWGTVDLDYHGENPADLVPDITKTVNPDGTVDYTAEYSTEDNGNIAIYPGGFRSVGTTHTTLQEIEIMDPTPGINVDYSGAAHGVITRTGPNTGDVAVTLYRDASHSVVTAKSDPTEEVVNGKVVLYEVDQYGNIPTNPADRKIAAVITVAENNLPEGGSNDFTIETGGIRNGGQEREDNIFATLNDIIDALARGDSEALPGLAEKIDRDHARIAAAQSENGARQSQMELLASRHSDDLDRHIATRTSRVLMDDQAMTVLITHWQASMQAFQAAMQVGSQVMQMSILQYL